MGEWDQWIGRTQEQSDVLTPGLLQRFRATIDSNGTGDVAPQGIHWCLCLPETATAELGGDGHPKRGAFMPPIPLPRRMWAASDVSFHAPIATGMAITRRSTIAEINAKRGASGELVFVTLTHETLADDILAVSERQSVVYRAAPNAPAQSATVDDRAEIDAWAVHRAITPSEALLFRYSALTFNSHRIHYDQPYATAVEGYRGLVVHGPLIATLLLDLAAREFGPGKLKQFSMRAVAPAIAREPLLLTLRVEGAKVHLAAIGPGDKTVMAAEGKRDIESA